ncbi:hypothetical protein GKQ38_04845 [Candidatus Nanohaloarchaea archaeon]|nr:hypothetical protein GKQ38_04845 [Candidatus Nanohaloarchaea archaeon]
MSSIRKLSIFLILLLVSSSLASSALIDRDSWECTNEGWSFSENTGDSGDWGWNSCSTNYVTYGSYSARMGSMVGSGSTYGDSVASGTWGQIYKTFDLTNVNQITFDIRTRWNSRATVDVIVGGNTLWSKGGCGYTCTYTDQTIDVSGYSGNTQIKIRQTSTTSNYDYWYAVDNWRVQGNTNSAPYAPSSPNPNNGASDVSTSPSISAYYNDPDGDSGTLYYYTGGGSFIDSCGVSDGSRCSVTYSGASSSGTTYDWYAVADDGSASTSSSTWSFTTNYAPSAPSNPSPNNGQDTVSTSPTLSVDVSDPDGDSMDVRFYDGNGDLIGTDTSVGSGYTASVTWSGLSTGTTYDWYAVADDGPETTSSSTWSFTTVHKPNQPFNPAPFDGENDVSTSHNLYVDVSHPDGLSMDVDFYIDDGGGFTYVGTDTGVSDGGRASINPSLSTGGGYNWYAVAKAQGHSRQSPTWGFSTNDIPSVDSVSKTDSSNNHAFSSVTAMVRDSDGQGDISSATLTVDDADGNTQSYSGTIDTSAGGSNEARVSFGSVSYSDNAGWGGNEQVQLDVQVTDTHSRTATGSSLARFPNHAPTISSGYSYSDDAQNHAFTLSIDAQDVDAGGSEITSCTVSHNDGDGNSYTSSGSLVQAETATCSFTISASSFTGYTKGEVINHQVTFTDRHGATVISSSGQHRIPNSAPTATNLQPSGSEVQYGPTLNATYNDADGDVGNLTFYNTSSGNVIGKVTGLSPGQQGSMQWSSADTPGTTYNFTVKAFDGVNATNTTENFTTIYEPKEPYDPWPTNQSTVDTTTRTDDEIAASVKVVHPDGRDMHVQFVNASNDQIMEIDYGVASGTRAKITNIGNKLRDKTNTTYNWYAVSKDTGTGEKTRSSLFTFDTVEVGDVMFDVMQGRNENMDITGNSDNGYRKIKFEITSTQMDPIPKVTVNETSTGDLIKSWTDVANNSVLTVDLVQDGGQEWNLNTDSQYQWFVEASEGPNILGQSLNYTIYTYNVTLDWDRAEKYYNVYQYDIYRAQDTGGNLVFNYGSGDYDVVGSLPETSFNDSGPGLSTGTFCWKVAASNPTGSSPAIPSGEGNCKTLN